FEGAADRKRDRERKEQQRKAREADAMRILSEDEINFYILMRTTDENSDGVIKRPPQPDSYIEYIKELSGVGWKDGILQKVILFQTAKQFLQYVKTGQIPGAVQCGGAAANWDEGEGTICEPDMVQYEIVPPKPVNFDTQHRPLKRNYS